MDLVIIDMGGDWGFATPNHIEQEVPPLLTIQGAFLTYRMWHAAGVNEAQWEAAKAFFVNLAGELRKPGRRANGKVRAA